MAHPKAPAAESGLLFRAHQKKSAPPKRGRRAILDFLQGRSNNIPRDQER